MATPYARSAVSQDQSPPVRSMTVALPPDVQAGDLLVLLAVGEEFNPVVGPEWDLVDRHAGKNGPYGAAWQRTVRRGETDSLVKVSCPALTRMAMSLLVIADPGLAVLRYARMTDGPVGRIRSAQGLSIGAAYVRSSSTREIFVRSTMGRTLLEGTAIGSSLYASVRFGPTAVGTLAEHAIELPDDYGQDFAGIMLDLVANPEKEGALIKGRLSAFLDQELVG